MNLCLKSSISTKEQAVGKVLKNNNEIEMLRKQIANKTEAVQE